MGAQGWLVGGWAAAGPSNAVEGERALMLKWGSVPQQLCWSHWRLFLPLGPFPGLWKTRVSSSWKGRSLGFEVTASQRSAWHLSPLWACTSHTFRCSPVSRPRDTILAHTTVTLPGSYPLSKLSQCYQLHQQGFQSTSNGFTPLFPPQSPFQRGRKEPAWMCLWYFSITVAVNENSSQAQASD